MAKIAYNNQQLRKIIEKDLMKTLKKIGLEIQTKWQEALWMNFYKKHEPSDNYKRTYEILDSITRTKVFRYKNGYKIEIYADMDSLSQSINGTFIQHKQTQFPLIQLIEEGYSVFGNRWVDGAFAFEEVLQEIIDRNFFLDEIKKNMTVKVY